MDDNPLISVIVPIYQVEKYLDECVKSIRMQTYSNLEIILVDDGSPDRCGEMCDQYAKEDARVRVIHQQNRGLSAARNSGLDIATGDYIGFVDSDDYLDSHFYEYLLNAMMEHPEARVVGCMFYLDENEVISKCTTQWKPSLYSYHSFCEDAILGKLSVAVWNKLYDTSLLKEIRFREGRVVEDALFMYDFSYVVKRYQANLLLLPDYLYYYRIRQGSICHGKDPILIESIRCRKDIASDCKEKNPEFHHKIQESIDRNILFLYAQLLNNKEWKQKYLSTYLPQVKAIGIKDILHYEVPLKSKLVLLIVKCFPSLYPTLRKIKKKFF